MVDQNEIRLLIMDFTILESTLPEHYISNDSNLKSALIQGSSLF